MSFTFSFGFTSYWLKKWRDFFKPIDYRGNTKSKQIRITNDTRVKGASHTDRPSSLSLFHNLRFSATQSLH